MSARDLAPVLAGLSHLLLHDLLSWAGPWTRLGTGPVTVLGVPLSLGAGSEIGFWTGTVIGLDGTSPERTWDQRLGYPSCELTNKLKTLHSHICVANRKIGRDESSKGLQ